MTRPGIGDTLDYRRLAELNRPTDVRAIGAAIRRLHADGLKPADIATALGIAVEQINLTLRQERKP